MENLIGSVIFIPLTHLLSFHIQEMNAKSRNVGRTLGLLNQKRSRYCTPSIYHILLVAVTEDISFGFSFCLIIQFVGDPTSQEVEVK